MLAGTKCLIYMKASYELQTECSAVWKISSKSGFYIISGVSIQSQFN